jgi:hypothetical protein
VPGPAPRPEATLSGVKIDEPLPAISSPEEAARALADKWGSRPGQKAIVFDFKGVEPARAEALARKIDDLFRQFPGPVHRVNEIRIEVLPVEHSGSTMMNDLVIKLNETVHSTLADAQAKGVEAAKKGWLSTDDAMHTLVHEFGHIAQGTVETALFFEGRTDPREVLRQGTRLPEPKKLAAKVDEVVKALGGPPRHEAYNRQLWLEEHLSGYAGTSDGEMLAEAFAEYILKGKDARPMAKALGEWMSRYLQAVPQ